MMSLPEVYPKRKRWAPIPKIDLPPSPMICIFKIKFSSFILIINSDLLFSTAIIYNINLALMNEQEVPIQETFIELQSNLTTRLIKRIMGDKIVTADFKK